jgi:stage II sporulation protein D
VVEEPPAAEEPPGAPALPADAVRIGLGRSQTSAEITSPAGLLVIDEEGVHWQSPPGQTVTLRLADGRVMVDGLAKPFSTVRIVPIPLGLKDPANPLSAPANPLTYNRRTYRGEIEVLISPRDGRLSVVNVVDLEEYLLAVVPEEVYLSWPAETLKAQAVASRTYALQSIGPRAKYADEGFDMVATPLSQAYGGLSREDPRTSLAVLETRGQVVKFQGLPAVTYYHASSGGHTENNEIIWTGGSPFAYLRGVADYDNLPGNDKYFWQLSFTPQQFSERLRAANYDVGAVLSIAPSGQIGVSGRPSHWQVRGTTGTTVSLRAEEMRWVLGLHSSVKNIALRQAPEEAPITRSYMPADTVHIMGANGQTVARNVQGMVVQGAAPAPVVATGYVVTAGPKVWHEPGVLVEGGGHGHGIGMSQWGAHGMALQGKSYVEILNHYYQGTKVENR